MADLPTPPPAAEGNDRLRREGHIVIVGASLAGLKAAEQLRAEGFAGSLTMIGDEPEALYDRPPLSKQVQTGWASSADTTLPRRREVGAEWKLGVAASGLDLKHNVVTLALSAAFSFDSHDRLEWFESSRISVHGTVGMR